MPTYTYRCSACEHQFDQVQRMTEEPLTECPVCGGTVKRVIHPVGVVFKGSGWYITDSRKPASSENGASSAKSGAKAEAAAGAADGKGGTGKAQAPAGDAAAKSDNAGTGEKPASGSKPAAAR